MKRFIASVLLLLIYPFHASAVPLSGTKSVGPTGNYASLTAAITDVQAQTLGGPLILELQATYVSTVETFPLTIPSLNNASAVNTLTIRPASGATALTIASANTTAATVDLNGAQFVTIDGRPGGVGSNAGSGGGTASQLTIANTTNSGVALRLINGASNDEIQYTTLKGLNSNGKGTVVFSTTTGANGNDNDTLDHCDLGDGASTPTNGIYAQGSTGTAAQNNSGNIVSNCNIFNFYGISFDETGIWLDAGNTNWTITGNSFYQTTSRAVTQPNVRAIYINNTSGNNFTITGNFIGGSAPSAGGTAWTTIDSGGGSVSSKFIGIWLNVGTTTASSVQGNTISNFVWASPGSTSTTPGQWNGIYVQAGSANIGTVTGNTIGSGTGTGAISITTVGNDGTSFGIQSGSSGAVAIANNTIGSITVNCNFTSNTSSLFGIQVNAGTNTISNNTVGSTTTANSLNAATSSTSIFTGQQVTGIYAWATSASITGNTVANLNNNYTGSLSAGQVRGIVAFFGTNTITGNTVHSLSTTSADTDGNPWATVLGIGDDSGSPGQTVSQNTVHSLVSTAPSGGIWVTGIYFGGPTSGTNLIARNLVHSLAAASSGATVNGMQFDTAAFTAQNNMVRVGLDASGASTAGAATVYGIWDSGESNGRNFYHNSVYVGGTETSGSANTAAFEGYGASNARAVQNNIFVNARSNNGGTGKHYAAVQSGGTSLSAGGNIFFAVGIGGTLGQCNNVDCPTLAAWQAATNQDLTSAVADPFFVNPTGTASTVDLHLQSSNPAEGQGIPTTDAVTGAPVTVVDDFDGQTRSSLTPVDIGADAGNFTWIDGSPPLISYAPLGNSSTTSRALTGWATIVDNVGVLGSANAPRLYFKKGTDADVFGVPNDSTGNGWKYVTTGNGSSPYSFTMDYSLLFGGSVAVGDTIQYFVVAQDAANNLGSSPPGATASANPPVQNISAKPSAGVNSFSIVSAISGTVTVGSGGAYPSLSGAGGLFAALNSGVVLTGNVTVNITSDTTEDGSSVINSLVAGPNYPAPGYTVTIQPDSPTMRTIVGSTGSGAAGLICLNGVQNVIIDGSSGGSGRYLTFRNTNTSGATIAFIDDASNNIVRNCVIEGSNNTFSTGVVFFGEALTTGNNNNLVTGNIIRDRSDAAGVPAWLVVNQGTFGMNNSGNTISGNQLFNFSGAGITITPYGSANWTITGNQIYEKAVVAPGLAGINFSGSGTNVIANNVVHDLTTTGQDGPTYGIYLDTMTGNTTVSGNSLYNLGGAGTTNIFGIVFTGSLAPNAATLVNNMVVLSQTGTDQVLCGIEDNGNDAVFNAYYNTVLIGGTGTGTSNTWACYDAGQSTATLKNNIFFNARIGGGSNYAAAGSNYTGPLVSDYNLFVGTGTPAAAFLEADDGLQMTFAYWQSAINGDAHSSSGNPGGIYTTAMFVNPAAGDLHLVLGGNVLVNGAGTPISGITTDYDGDLRSATAPTIGADEAVTTFATWAASYAVSNDPSVIGSNGLKNIFNFAFGISPNTGGSGTLIFNGNFSNGGTIAAPGLPLTRIEGADMRAVFMRRSNFATAGLGYTVQFSGDLSNWQNSTVVPTVLADDGTNQIVSVPYPAGLGADGFFRVQVSLP